MAVNETRSLTADLTKGKNDGILKTLNPDRGGEVETQAVLERAGLLQRQYNITDAVYDIGDFEKDGYGYA